MMRRAVLVVAALCGVVHADKPDDFVDVATVIPDAVIDLRYATAANFTGVVLYPVAHCKLRRAVAERLAKAAKALRGHDRRLVLWDCYRPSSIQAVLWKKLPDPRYVADPKHGSRHSRGAAVDVAVVAKDGSAVELPTGFDDFTVAAHRDRAISRSAEARVLEQAMMEAGFVGLSTEWWHFDAPGPAGCGTTAESRCGSIDASDRYPLSDEAL